jgi:hypothetical protein
VELAVLAAASTSIVVGTKSSVPLLFVEVAVRQLVRELLEQRVVAAAAAAAVAV